MAYDKADEVIKEIFESLLYRYEILLETMMKIVILSLILFKTSFERVRSYIDSPDRIKNKGATINPINYDEKCF